MSIRAYVTIVGVVIAAYGILFMFLGISAHTATGQAVDCGSAAMPGSTTTFTDGATCGEAIDARQAWTFPVLVAGLLVIGGAVVVGRPRRSRKNTSIPT